MKTLECWCEISIPFCTVLGVIFVLLFLLLIAPICYFLVFGWAHRRDNILSNFTGPTATYYFRCFHRSEGLKELDNIAASEAQLRDAAARVAAVDNLRTQASGLRAANQIDEAVNLEQQIAQDDALATANLKAAETKLRADQKASLELFVRYYKSQFGRQHFVLPLLLLMALAGCGLYLVAVSVRQWQASGSVEGGVLPMSVALAFTGGWTWVVFDMVTRAAR
ncbi:MAG TPA: hypothetical protein VE988_00005, partial [Gemmataceae bacterium]|nr:hypothetical protein [Gemmataceae bacterium]